MSGSHNTLCIDSFYPETELKITEIQQDKEQILIRVSPLILIPSVLQIRAQPSQLVSMANVQIKSAHLSVMRL